MVLDTAKLKNRKSTTEPSTCGRDAAKELVDSQDEHYKGIHDRFLKHQVCRESQLKMGWTEQKCIEMDELAQQDHTYRLSEEEFKRYQGQWYLTLNKSGKNAPMRLRHGFRAAVSLKNRLHRESGERIRDFRRDRQPEIHATLKWEDSSKNYGANQQRQQISDLHFAKFPNPATFACWKLRFKTEACTCSQFPTEAVLWIKEVEMVESVDDQKSSRSIRGTHGPDFEVLDAKTASALNRIIQNTRFKKERSVWRK